MKRITMLTLVLCVAALTAACSGGGTREGNAPIDTESTVVDEESTAVDEADTDSAKANADATVDTANAPDNQQSSDDIKKEKTETARTILSDLEAASTNPSVVYTSAWETTNLKLVSDFITAVEANKTASFWGVLPAATIPEAYEIQYTAGGELTITYYHFVGETYVSTDTITDIYETETFYMFTDSKNCCISIPKQKLNSSKIVEEIGTYEKGSDLPGSKITAKQACEAVVELDARYSGYLQYTGQNDIRGQSHAYGTLIPEGFSGRVERDEGVRTVTNGAVKILGKPYYRVAVGGDDLFSVCIYYIDPENSNTVFDVSMLDGSLGPIALKYTKHTPIPTTAP